MKTALLGLALLLVCACGGSSPPNVVFIVMDTTRADRCTTNGYERPTTPHLAAIAKEGANFRNTWSPAGWTGPSHATMFTGLRPESHGYLRGTRSYLDAAETTLAERLRDAGYRTACFTNNDTITPQTGLTQGFAKVVPMYDRKAIPYPAARETHRLAFDWALESHRGKEPFFLFINDMEPHFPYTPPKELAKRFVSKKTPASLAQRARDLPFLDTFLNNAGTKPISAEMFRVLSDLYDAEIACLDAELDWLVGRLRAEGILDNTILVITSDHGENLGERGQSGHIGSLNRTIRHVPLVVRYPARVAKGSVVDDVVCLEDLTPTLLELCGLPVPAGLDGRHLLDRDPARRARATLGPASGFLERMRMVHGVDDIDPRLTSHVNAVFDGRHHYIRYSDGREELYDLDTDPDEERNLATTGGGKLNEMRSLLP